MSATLALTLMLAQSVPGEAGDAAQLDRIRRALAEPPAITLPASRLEGPVFRVTVYGSKPEHSIWDRLFPVPSYIRPQMPIYHFEFLQQVTPEEFRAGTLYPPGVPIGPLIKALFKGVKAADGQRRKTKAREEVRRALEEFLACRADPSRAGC